MLFGMDTREGGTRLIAAQKLLMEETTSREKFSHVSALVKGLHPKIDEVLTNCEKALSSIDKIQGGDVIGLSADHLPENTEDEKKRKKYLLLFLNSWRQLKSEVARVQAEFDQANGQNAAQQTSMWGKIFSGAKGPLGFVTVIAVGVVAMQQTSVNITIQNNGCGTMQVSGGIPLNIPGLSFPKDPIPSGGSSVVTIPPLSMIVDGSKAGSLSLTALNYSLGFDLPNNIDDVTLNGASLLGKKTDVRLSESDSHTLELICS